VNGYLSENFSRPEFACRCGCGFDTVDVELVRVLQMLRNAFGKVVEITSGCRCEKWNREVQGAIRSRHLWGQAADFAVYDTTPDQVVEYLEANFPDRYGVGKYPEWVHLDVRANRVRW
jgi:uncharacterized protein YcbK (DUF882 family)